MTETTEPHCGPLVTRSDATARGLKRYFTGKPCSKGHIAERFLSGGQCEMCNCSSKEARARQKKYSDAHPELFRERRLAAYNKNREYRLAYRKAYYRENLVKHLEYTNNWRATHPGYQIEWRAKNPDKRKAQSRTSSHNRRARKQGGGGTFTEKEVGGLFVSQRGKCAYAGHRQSWCEGKITLQGCHRDHIVPLARGGANFIRNIQLLCQPCNQRKHAKDPLAFARQIGLLI